MKTLKIIMLGLLLAVLATTGDTASGATTSELLQQGLYAEEVEGNIDSAIKAYDQIIKNGSAPPNHVAQALYREGMCYLKLKDEASTGRPWKNWWRITRVRPRSWKRPGRPWMN